MAGRDGFGVTLERSNMTGSPVFAAIGNIVNVGGPEIERETYDVTAHDSTGGWREFIGGLKDGGEVSVELNYDPDIHDVLVGDFDDISARDYRLTWPTVEGQATGARWAFTAFMTGFAPEGPSDDKLACEITFKVTGKPTLTAAVEA